MTRDVNHNNHAQSKSKVHVVEFWFSMEKLLFGLVLFSCISFGSCLQCYQCLSARDWSDCDSNKKKMTCLPGQSACAKFEQELRAWGGSIYGKGCTNTEGWCTDILKKPEICGDNNCVAHCCSKELCNEAALPMVSVITLLACVLVAFLR